ncbi:helix-turn-helix transcriptional regulator [Neoaquamicrobium microcysteis]|uniref:helix-turn-helix transcriptional regulator n=1 Tax=Neoaquamicrobium microcysteis TaxID=2682781 RepID=UPI0013761A02|nr:AlpA family phage regulatory protein [Mesorhizobium microcysteis]
MTEHQTLLRLADVLARTGLKRSTLYNLIARGDFPRPIRPQGLRVALFSSVAVSEWIESQLSNGETK